MATETNKCDDKWIDALRAYVGGGIMPYYKLPDGSVDAVKTAGRFLEMFNIRKVAEGGEDQA